MGCMVVLSTASERTESLMWTSHITNLQREVKNASIVCSSVRSLQFCRWRFKMYGLKKIGTCHILQIE